ncbi:unnamed protein product [Rotaria sordida]|uniref:Tesmin/TSO1-like CXC domain-containing protein n=1 Tax=Rotaria sordida TaxID=392033 RepID=A0A819UH54_9BILA|nr:unnamed protein product [Rotaria sordida]
MINNISSGAVLVIAGPHETVTKLEKDKLPVDVFELQSNHVEADTRMIFHIDQLIQNSYFNITVKSIDSDVLILCIYYASLLCLQKLIVDATVPKKPPKIIDCTYIHNALIDKYHVNPLCFIIIYALSGCDTCSFTRNISKRTFMQILLDTPNDFADVEKLTVLPTSRNDIVAAETLFVQCFCSNRRRRQALSITSGPKASHRVIHKDVSINELRAIMAMNALKKNSTSIVTLLPPTQDALFYHCLRVSRQVQIWLQAPDGYIKYPDLEDSGFQIIDGRPEVKWTSKLPFPNDRQLSSCGKHKGKCTKCVCVLNQLPCTIFCQCSIDCQNRKSIQTVTANLQTVTKSTTEKHLLVAHQSKFVTELFDQEYSSEDEIYHELSTSTETSSCDEINELTGRIKR